ncbi:MAG TPA: hypothetical protein VEK31_11625, partial [Xanthobacteraceae bacterium]|nr:hypothetical protein [Xanthobacteraceae bacterium]
MILKSGDRFSEKIVLQQQTKAKCRFKLKSFCLSAEQKRKNDHGFASLRICLSGERPIFRGGR